MKTARKIVSIIYALSSLVLVYIIVMSAIYSLTKIGINDSSIGIIGGADGPTAKFITTKLFGIGGIGFLLFPFSVVAFNTLNLISVFSKRQISNTLLLMWAVLNLGLFLAVPSQSTAVVTYSLYRPIRNTVWMYLFGTILSPKNIFLVSSVVLIFLLSYNTKNICPWCGYKINRFKDGKVLKRATPASLMFARCSHCHNCYGQNIKSKRNIIAIIGVVLVSILSVILQNGHIAFLIFIFLGVVITSPLEKMTQNEEVFKDIKNYEWEINTDSLQKRVSCSKEFNGWYDEAFIVTKDNKYGIFFYNICEVSMCSYYSALAIFSADNLNAPLIDIKPENQKLTGRIEGYKRYFYAPLSNCIIMVCIVNGEFPFLLIKPNDKRFALIPFDYTSIYYSVTETEENKLVLEESSPNELKQLKEKGYKSKTGTQFILDDLTWYDLTDFKNIEEIYFNIKGDSK